VSRPSSVLVFNAGSSSLKFAIHDTHADRPLISGQIGGIGGAAYLVADGRRVDNAIPSDARYGDAFQFIFEWLSTQGHDPARLDAFGHRIVHGGDLYSAPVIVDDAVECDLKTLLRLAPLHMPAGVEVLARARRLVPRLPQIACFDTAFHATQPWEAVRLPLPRAYDERGCRRYGFHGLSYEHVVSEIPQMTGELPGRLIVAHLGQGASICAIRDGKSIATTMGYSTADGLVMGTRTGSIDPGVLLALVRDEHLSAEALEDLIYRRGGLLGLSGISGDMRALLESDAPEAKKAIDHYCYWAARHAGSLATALEGVDAMVFTGGVGENAPLVRARILDRLRWLGADYDPERNQRNEAMLSPAGSRCPAYIVLANEELAIARHAFSLIP
jgi:acetate kinase